MRCGICRRPRVPHEHFNLKSPQTAPCAVPPYNSLKVGQYLQSKYCGRKQLKDRFALSLFAAVDVAAGNIAKALMYSVRLAREAGKAHEG